MKSRLFIVSELGNFGLDENPPTLLRLKEFSVIMINRYNGAFTFGIAALRTKCGALSLSKKVLTSW